VIPGYGQAAGETINATGIVGRLLLTVTFTLTGDGTTPTATSQWPWNAVKSLQVAANGINNLFSCDGIELRALQRVRHPYFVDRLSSFALPVNAGTSTVTLYFEIPLAFDDESLMGAVFAQTQDTNLTWKITFANSADLFSAHAPTLSAATAQVDTEFYSIPYIDTSNQGRVAVIPDLRRMHGFYSQTNPIATTTYSPLMRVNGILVRVFQRGNNAANAAGDVDWETLCTNHQFNYGSNVTPYDVQGAVQRSMNNWDYGDKTLPASDALSGSVDYVVDDFVHDNALRDVIHLLGVTQPQMINVFNGLSIDNGQNSVIQTAQEHMIAGA
jgi:hypothetical protein